MKYYIKVFCVILITCILLSILMLNNTVFANTGVDYVLSTWNNYPNINHPNFDGGWGVRGDVLYTSKNIHWTGFWNEKEKNATDRVMEFQLRLTGSHRDPFGWTFRHREISPGTFSFYAVEISPRYDELTLAKVTSWKPSTSDPVHGGPVYHGIISSADGYYTNSSYRKSGFAGALSNCSGSILQRVSIPFDYGTWYSMKIDVTGNRIRVWYNGQLKIDYTDNNNPLTHGGYGPYTASQYQAEFREIYINGSSFLNVPPNIVSVSSPIANSHYWAGSNMTISGVVKEPDGRGTVTVKYAFDDDTATDLITLNSTGENQNFSKDIIIPKTLSEGLHNLKIWAKDSENGVSDVVIIPIYINKAKTPANLTFTNITNESMTISWSTNGNPSGTIYELYDATSNKLLYSGTDTTFLRTELKPNTQYQYKIRAKDSYGNYSSYLIGTKYTLANQPYSKGYDNITSNSVRLLWNPNGNPSNTTYHYEVRRKSDNSLVLQGTVNGTSVTVTGLSGGHEQYRYFVRAKNGDNIYTDFTELIIPSLVVYQKSNYAKAEWAIEMEDEDVLYQTSFEEGDELPYLNFGGIDKAGGKYGGQSFTTESSYDGIISLKIHDTYTNGQHAGRPDLDGVVPFSNFSRAIFEKKYIKNGANLSVSFWAKTTGSGTISPVSQYERGEYALPLNITFSQDVEPGDTTVKVSDVSIFKSYIDNNKRYYLAEKKYDFSGIYVTSVDVNNSTITVNKPFQQSFKKGDYLLNYTELQPVIFPNRNINNNEWKLFNVNTKVADKPYYDTLKKGFSFAIWTTTAYDVYIDNVKMGYATKAELYRDGVKIYEGFLSDYDDYEAIDKAKPDSISTINVNNTGNQINISFEEPIDHGTTYNYQVKAIKHTGDIISSEVKSVTITSGIKGYSYVIDSNPNTIPDDIVDVITSNISEEINPNVKNYIHIKVIDNEGNVSQVFHQEINVPVLTAIPVHQENYIRLEWDILDTSKLYSYNIYQKREDLSTFNKISSNNTNKIFNNYTGKDITGPTKPTITDVRMINNGNTIHIEYTNAKDRGTKYYYYVEGNAQNTKVQSNIAEATIKTGLKGYSIVVDQNPDTIPDNIIETTELSFDINQKFYQRFYVHVAAVDNAGNISDVAHYECTDTVPPIINVTGNATEWTNQNVVLTATAYDNESGLKGIKLPDDTWVYSDIATFVVTSNGKYTFVAEDNFGNQKSVTIVVDKIDKTPPLNTSIIINNGDLYTNTRDVVLTIDAQDNATGISEMRFRTENSPWSAWVPYTTTFNYTMDAGFTHQGTNRVYVQFKDGVGNIGGDAFDSIVYDSIAPAGEIIYPKNTVNTRSINLTINAYDINPASADVISGLNSVRFRELQDGIVKQDWTSWEQHSFTRNWILSDGDGVKIIEMEIRDNAGNIGRVSRSIVLDTLFIKEALFTDIVNPPLGNPELPTSEVVKVKKGYEFTFIVKTSGEPDKAVYTFNGESGEMEKITDNLFRKTLKVDINDDSVNNELLPIKITVMRNDGTYKTTTLKVHIEGSAYDDYNINLTN